MNHLRTTTPATARIGLLAMAAMATLSATAAWAATGHPHEHGVARLDMAVDGQELLIDLEMPLDSVVGYERAPRTDAERAAAQAMLARLRDGAALFKPDAAADCRPGRVEVDAPVLQGKAGAAEAHAPGDDHGQAGDHQEDHEDDHDHDGGHDHDHHEGHADLDAEYLFQCTHPEQLRQVDIQLFDLLPRLQRIDVQTASGHGQGRAVLQRPKKRVTLAR